MPVDLTTGNLLSYMLTKNKQYMELSFREYMLETFSATHCPLKLPNVLEPYRHAYAVQYSNLNLNRFFVGSFDLTLDDDGYIEQIT